MNRLRNWRHNRRMANLMHDDTVRALTRQDMARILAGPNVIPSEDPGVYSTIKEGPEIIPPDPQVYCENPECGWKGSVRQATDPESVTLRCPECHSKIHY